MFTNLKTVFFTFKLRNITTSGGDIMKKILKKLSVTRTSVVDVVVMLGATVVIAVGTITMITYIDHLNQKVLEHIPQAIGSTEIQTDLEPPINEVTGQVPFLIGSDGLWYDQNLELVYQPRENDVYAFFEAYPSYANQVLEFNAKLHSDPRFTNDFQELYASLYHQPDGGDASSENQAWIEQQFEFVQALPEFQDRIPN